VTSLRQRVLNELQRRNYSPETTRGYIHAIKQFADYFGKSPEKLGAEEIRQFQLHLLKEKKLAPGTVEGRMSALRFLYKKTLKRRDIAYDDLVFPKVPRKLPVVLSPDEITSIIEAAPNLMHRTILMLLYATGIRRAEAALLKVSDVDSERMVIHIQLGKGSRDRDVPMTPKLLEALRQYWRWKHPKVYLFPSTEGHRGEERPISDKTVWYACKEAAARAGIKKRIGPHTLRHSFATHLMEAGTDLRTIQLLMGHAHLEDTTVYLQLSQRHLRAAPNPLDQITIGSQSFSRKRPDNYQA
jgi:integrase/recombinase XerD